jgi:hypothetical protein
MPDALTVAPRRRPSIGVEIVGDREAIGRKFEGARRLGRELHSAMDAGGLLLCSRTAGTNRTTSTTGRSRGTSRAQRPRAQRRSRPRSPGSRSDDPPGSAPPLGRPAVTNLGECDQCGTEFIQPATGRPRRHCSDACRQRAYRQRQSTRAGALTFETRQLVKAERDRRARAAIAARAELEAMWEAA